MKVDVGEHVGGKAAAGACCRPATNQRRNIAARSARMVVAFRRDRKAAAAVEFALIAFASLELLLEGMQVGLYFYTSAGIERATAKAVRQILTGSANTANYTATQFRNNVICPAITPTSLSCSNLITNIQTVSEATSPGGFYTLLNSTQTGLTQPPLDNTQTAYCIGSSQSYVFVQVLYAMPVFSPIWRAFATSFNGTASFIVQSSAAFRNEPFPPGSQSC